MSGCRDDGSCRYCGHRTWINAANGKPEESKCERCRLYFFGPPFELGSGAFDLYDEQAKRLATLHKPGFSAVADDAARELQHKAERASRISGQPEESMPPLRRGPNLELGFTSGGMTSKEPELPKESLSDFLARLERKAAATREAARIAQGKPAVSEDPSPAPPPESPGERISEGRERPQTFGEIAGLDPHPCHSLSDVAKFAAETTMRRLHGDDWREKMAHRSDTLADFEHVAFANERSPGLEEMSNPNDLSQAEAKEIIDWLYAQHPSLRAQPSGPGITALLQRLYSSAKQNIQLRKSLATKSKTIETLRIELEKASIHTPGGARVTQARFDRLWQEDRVRIQQYADVTAELADTREVANSLYRLVGHAARRLLDVAEASWFQVSSKLKREARGRADQCYAERDKTMGKLAVYDDSEPASMTELIGEEDEG